MTRNITYLWLILSIIIVDPHKLIAQAEVDSLKKRLSKTSPENHAEIYFEIAKAYRFANLDSAMLYLKKTETLAGQFGQKQILAEVYSLLGENYMKRATYDSALIYHVKSSELYYRLDMVYNQSKELSYAGNIRLILGDYSSALNTYIKAYNLFENLQDTTGIIYTNTCMGQVHHTLRDFNNAESKYIEALKMAELTRDTAPMARLWNNLGLTYLETKNLELAGKYLHQAKNYYAKTGDWWIGLSVMNNIALLYDYSGQYDEAINIYKQIITFSDSIDDKLGVAYALSNLGDISAKTGQYDVSKTKYLESLDLAYEIEKPDLIRNLYEKLSEVSRKLHDTEAAFGYLEKFIVVKDSVFNIEKNEQILEIQNRFNISQKEKEILLLQKEKDAQELLRRVITAIAVFVLIITLMTIILLRLRMVKNKKIRQQEQILFKQQQELSKAELDKKTLIEEQLLEKVGLAHRKLTASALNIIQKNELMIELKKKLDHISNEKTDDINSLIHYNFKLDKDWEKFRFNFEQIHKGFYTIIKKKYPDLSSTELKLIALIRLDFSIKQTASILGISSDSVKTYRSRVRKKLNLEQGENLSEFLLKF